MVAVSTLKHEISEEVFSQKVSSDGVLPWKISRGLMGRGGAVVQG